LKIRMGRVGLFERLDIGHPDILFLRCELSRNGELLLQTLRDQPLVIAGLLVMACGEIVHGLAQLRRSEIGRKRARPGRRRKSDETNENEKFFHEASYEHPSLPCRGSIIKE